jgi:hypothetical protein
MQDLPDSLVFGKDGRPQSTHAAVTGAIPQARGLSRSGERTCSTAIR